MKKKLIVAAICLAALTVVLIVGLALHRGKVVAVSDDDLAFVRTTVSSNENAFYILEEGARELRWPDRPSQIKELTEWKSWDANLAAQLLDKNQNALELFDKASACSHLQVPEIVTIFDEFPYLEGWKRLSQLATIRSISLFQQGETREAVASALRIARLGHQMEGSDGLLLHYLVGSAVKTMALHSLQQMTASSLLSCDITESYRQELNQIYVNVAALTNVFKNEYQLQKKQADNFLSGQGIAATNNFVSKRLFDPERTRYIHADFARTGIKSIGAHYNNLPTNSFVVSTNRSMFSYVLSGNAIGRILSEMSLPSNRIASQKCKENVTVAATQTTIAIKCYKKKYGSLPTSLDKLVPEFLPSVPIDDFDAKPIRYSADRKIVYSVGPDLIDSGGQDKDTGKRPLDIPFKIEF